MSPSAKDNARQRAAAARAAEQQAARRRRTTRWLAVGGGVVAVIVAVVVIALTTGGSSSTPGATSTPSTSTSTGTGSGEGPLGPENIPIEEGVPLASAAGAASGQTVDGIKCESSEQVAYHIHAHLAVYVDGKLRPIPIGIGIVKPIIQQTSAGGFAGASNCYYWLHVHAQDGVIHIESPSQKTYTLGNFFNIWQQPLSATQVATASGQVTAYVNGKQFSGDPASIPLTPHATIQLTIGSPAVAPQSVDWAKSSL